MQKTYSLKAGEIKKQWFVIDANKAITGRLAVIAADILRGKKKPYYTPYLDCGDNLIIINVEKVALTGKKRTDSKFYWHTGYPGGIKSITPQKTFDSKNPERVLKRAIERMIPRNPLGRKQLKNLRLVVGDSHNHQGQAPIEIDISTLNNKNILRTA